MGMVDDLMTVTATKTTVTSRDEFGEIKTSTAATVNCWFREINEFNQQGGIEDYQGRDAMGWFPTSHSVVAGDLYTIQGTVWQAQKVTVARDPFNAGAGEFKKVLFNRFKTLVS